jgi:ubiquinone/menaquinone biosynthesis C-methylase UbiE
MTTDALDLGSLADVQRAGETPPEPTGSRFSAAIYDPFLAFAERAGMRERRRQLLASARGRVLEIGAGTGLNLDQYPDAVDELLLSEPVPPMAERLRKRLLESGRRGEVLDARAEQLPVPDASVETVVSTMVLCTVGDPAGALAEIKRVLKPDGRFLFCEHVRSDSPRLERWQRRLAGPWAGFAEGCRCDQPTLELIQRELRLERVERESWRRMPSLVRPLVIGEAVKGETEPAE